MLELNTPQKLWGIAHDATDFTGRLWNDNFFIFRSHAEHEIEKTLKIFEDDGAPMTGSHLYPVLLNVTATYCPKSEADAYEAKQAAWLAERGQAAKRCTANDAV